MKKKITAVLLVLMVLLGGIYYYLALPALNFHSAGFWVFMISIACLVFVGNAVRKMIKDKLEIIDLVHEKSLKINLIILAAMILIFAVGGIASSQMINAKKYQKLMTVETRDFAAEIQQTDFSNIPLLDKDSAKLLGERKMGTMVDMVSQFEVSDIYTQINYQGKPVRVSPLKYANTIKWFTNHDEGIPGYIMIDMATQETQCVRLEKGSYIRYSESELFNRNIHRHLRFRYPTYIFDDLSFEIDEEGTPYWICPVKKFNVGLFGGYTIGKVVICNAVTGDTTEYDISEVPAWIDHVYSADLLINLYDYHGLLKRGYWNSVFSQKECLQTTDGYNYLVKDDDVWVYTGVTSVSGDESNVGFVLMNQRTMESQFYSCPGAEEYSAMESAEGQVQHLGYDATFPLLLNVSNEPTYFMALKDSAGLVKMYAMVNISKYQNVAIGNTIGECLKSYQTLLKENGISTSGENTGVSVSGVVSQIAPVVLDGNSHYYITLEGKTELFDIPVSEYPQIVTYQIGDQISLDYMEGDPLCLVIEIK